MLTREQILEAVKNGRESGSIDHRDFQRLAGFFPAEHLPTLGFTLNEGATWEVKELTRENVLAQLAEDVKFGFEKALNKRGLSAQAMYAVVKMWMWVLEDRELEKLDWDDYSDYAQYGLPFLKAVAVKYGLPNPIGDDTGSEGKYAS